MIVLPYHSGRESETHQCFFFFLQILIVPFSTLSTHEPQQQTITGGRR